jgi:hypothetical protein
MRTFDKLLSYIFIYIYIYYNYIVYIISIISVLPRDHPYSKCLYFTTAGVRSDSYKLLSRTSFQCWYILLILRIHCFQHISVKDWTRFKPVLGGVRNVAYYTDLIKPSLHFLYKIVDLIASEGTPLFKILNHQSI